MPPVVDPRHQQAKKKDPQSPTCDLFVNRLPVDPSPALAVVEGGPDEAADRSGGPDSEAHARDIGDEKTKDAAHGVNAEHPMGSEFPNNKGRQLPEGKHIEENMQDAPVEVIGRDKGPPPIKLADGDSPRCAHEEKTSI